MIKRLSVNNIHKKHISAVLVLLLFSASGYYLTGNAAINRGANAKASITTPKAVSDDGTFSLTTSGFRVSPIASSPSLSKVTVDITVSNTSAGLMQISPGLQMYLNTNTGTSYPFTAEYLPAGTTIGGPLASKNIMTLGVDYKIPISETPNSLTFHPDGSTKPLTVRF